MLRAVADSTQPYGPLLEGKTVHTLQVLLNEAFGVLYLPVRLHEDHACLQEYLADPSQIDIVYRTVLDRASGEPLRSIYVDCLLAHARPVQLEGNLVLVIDFLLLQFGCGCQMCCITQALPSKVCKQVL